MKKLCLTALVTAALASSPCLMAQDSTTPDASGQRGNGSGQVAAPANPMPGSPSQPNPRVPAMSSAAKGADADFVTFASGAGMTEVEAGQTALKNSQSDQVKTFAQQMVDDHTKAGDELKSIAATKQIPVAPTPPPANQKMNASLATKMGPAFDAAYKKQMIADHKKVIDRFEKESKSGMDPDLKAFASKTLPTLQHHLQMAQQLPAGK